MRDTYCYLPILPARGGAFLALKWLSPLAVSRLIPLFDIPDPVLRDGETLDAHFAKRAKGINEAWTRNRPAYVDMHNLPSHVRMSSGAHPLTYVFEYLNNHGSQAIPVTGTTADRDAAYSSAARTIVRQNRRGASLRLAREDLENRSTLGAGISKALDFLQLTPVECDLLFDFRYVLDKEVNGLRAFAIRLKLTMFSDVAGERNISIYVRTLSSRPILLAKTSAGAIIAFIFARKKQSNRVIPLSGSHRMLTTIWSSCQDKSGTLLSRRVFLGASPFPNLSTAPGFSRS